MVALIILGIILLILLIVIVSNVKVVPQAHAYVIERLGTYHVTWSTGLHVKIPFIDKISKKVSLKEQVIDFPPQPVIKEITLRCRLTRLCILKLPIQSFILTV